GATMVLIGPQLPWLLVIGDVSEDDPGVAAQPEDPEPASSWVVAEPEKAAEVGVSSPVCCAAMPAPRPRNSTALSVPATTRDRAAGWRRRDDRRGGPGDRQGGPGGRRGGPPAARGGPGDR